MKQEVVHPGRPGESSGCQVITYPGQEAWMNVDKNARLTPYRREELVTRALRGEAMAGLAWQCGISIRTARKWLARYRAEGPSGLQDRSSRPHASPRATAPAIQLGIQVLRHQRWTCAQIAAAVGVSAATAARIVRRAACRAAAAWRRRLRCIAMSTPVPAICSISTRRNSGALPGWATASPGAPA